MPFEFAFLDMAKGLKGAKIFDQFIDYVFLLDFILMFLTSYLSNDGNEIKDSLRIGKKYTSTTRFYTDFLSILGMEQFTSLSPNLKILGLFKILRVFRINVFIKRLNIDAVNKSYLNLCRLTFLLFLYLHCVGCFLWTFVKINVGVYKVRPSDGVPID